VGAEIAHRVALAEQESLEGFLVLETGMVGTDGDGEFLHEGSWAKSEGKETRVSCGCRYWEQVFLHDQLFAMKPRIVLVALVLALAGCATTPADRIAQHRSAFDTWPAEVQTKIRAGQIAVGFTEEQVRMALGDPERVITRTTEQGVSWSGLIATAVRTTVSVWGWPGAAVVPAMALVSR